MADKTKIEILIEVVSDKAQKVLKDIQHSFSGIEKNSIQANKYIDDFSSSIETLEALAKITNSTIKSGEAIYNELGSAAQACADESISGFEKTSIVVDSVGTSLYLVKNITLDWSNITGGHTESIKKGFEGVSKVIDGIGMSIDSVSNITSIWQDFAKKASDETITGSGKASLAIGGVASSLFEVQNLMGNLSNLAKSSSAELANGFQIAGKVAGTLGIAFSEIQNVTKTFGNESASIMEKIGATANAAFNIAGAIMGNFFEAKLEDLESYDTAIADSYAKQEAELSQFDEYARAQLAAFDEEKRELNNTFDEEQQAKNEEKKELDNIDREEKIINLEAEYIRSLERGDTLGAEALRIKLEDLNAQKAKDEEEKKMAVKKAAEKSKADLERQALEKKLAKERTVIELKTNKDIATAEYNKAVAEHGNQVAIAESEKQKAIADGVLSIAKAAVQAGLALGTSIVQLGPIIGLGMGLAAGVGIIGAVGGAAGGIASAAQSLDAVKASKPEPPKFAYGTGGYSIPQGESAIVGEQGQEIVTNRGGDLQVTPTATSKDALSENNTGGNTIIENIIINVQELTNSDQVLEILNEIKTRGVSYAI